jgi:sortase A
MSISSAVTRGFVALGVLGIWALMFATGLSSLSGGRSQQLMYSDLRAGLAAETIKTGGNITPGTPLGLIEVPQIGLRYVFVEGTSAEDLQAGPGHVRTSPLPGQAGQSYLFGRALTFGGPFKHIGDLRRGAQIFVTTQQGTFTYVVDGVRRAGDPKMDPPGSDASRLTLVSAEGVSWRAGWVPDEAVFVDSTLQGPTVPTPANRPTYGTEAENPMQGDPAALTPLVLWVQLLLLTAIGSAWALSRWGGPQTWLVAVPVTLAVLWGTSLSAINLLPNLM